MAKDWIQKAIKHPGALKSWLKRNKIKLERKIHMKIFDEDGKIKITALKKIKKLIEEGEIRPRNKEIVLRRIVLALNLHKVSEKRHSKKSSKEKRHKKHKVVRKHKEKITVRAKRKAIYNLAKLLGLF